MRSFVLVLLVTPVFIAPLFNKFGPMKDKALEGQVLAVAAQAGVEGARVFEVNKSVDTEKVNAYVTGVGKTKRIVLWDTLLARLSPRRRASSSATSSATTSWATSGSTSSSPGC